MASVRDQTIIDVWSRQDGLCGICGDPLSESAWECHHMTRKADGGDDSPDNLVLLCDRDEHEYAHGGNFRQELATTADAYPYFYGQSGNIDYEEPAEDENDVEDSVESTQVDNDSEVEENTSDGGLG